MLISTWRLPLIDQETRNPFTETPAGSISIRCSPPESHPAPAFAFATEPDLADFEIETIQVDCLWLRQREPSAIDLDPPIGIDVNPFRIKVGQFKPAKSGVAGRSA